MSTDTSDNTTKEETASGTSVYGYFDWVFTLTIDELIVKKNGFLLTLRIDKELGTVLDEELKTIAGRYKNLIERCEKYRGNHTDSIEDRMDLISDTGIELLQKKVEYENYLEELLSEERELKEELRALHKQVLSQLQRLGLMRENIVTNRLGEISDELSRASYIHEQVQTAQNTILAARYKTDQPVISKKIKFWEDMLEVQKESYEKVAARMKKLSSDGLNSPMSSLFIVIGGFAALVSGWWFSIWAGSADPEIQNVSLKILVLLRIKTFFAGYTIQEMLGILGVYIVSVGLVSWLCHLLLVKFKLISLRKKKQDNENDEQYEIDWNQEDELLKFKLRTNSWWGFWLRITPIILALTPIAMIVSTGSKDHDMKDLMNTMSNQFTGTLLAIISSVFMILLLGRITEKKYHEEVVEVVPEKKETKWYAFLSSPFRIGLLLFAVMFLVMCLHLFPGIGTDVRRVAIFGFIAGCFTTGFAFAYGYIFKGLQGNAQALSDYIDDISSHVVRLSAPWQVNYTSNITLRQKIYGLQDEIFKLIRKRQELAANALAASSRPESVAQRRQGPFKRFWKSLFGEATPSSVYDRYGENGPANSINMADARYFPEITFQLKEHYARIAEVCARLSQIDTEYKSRWRGDGIWKQIIDQVAGNHKKLEELEKERDRVEKDYIRAEERLKALENKECVLLREGYYTGLWIKDIGPETFTGRPEQQASEQTDQQTSEQANQQVPPEQTDEQTPEQTDQQVPPEQTDEQAPEQTDQQTKEPED